MRYGLNGNYRPQRLIVNYTSECPVGHPGGLEGELIQGWNLSGVTTIQNGTPLTITDTRGGTIFYGPGQHFEHFNSHGPICAGQTNANIPTSGTLQQRVLNGLGGAPVI